MLFIFVYEAVFLYYYDGFEYICICFIACLYAYVICVFQRTGLDGLEVMVMLMVNEWVIETRNNYDII